MVGGILFLELVLVLGSWTFADQADDLRLSPQSGRQSHQRRGDRPHTLYRLRLSFQASGLILLVAMIGAIVLTHPRASRHAAAEHRRAGLPHRVDRMEKVPTGAGIKALGIRRRRSRRPKPDVTHEAGHGGHH